MGQTSNDFGTYAKSPAKRQLNIDSEIQLDGSKGIAVKTQRGQGSSNVHLVPDVTTIEDHRMTESLMSQES